MPVPEANFFAIVVAIQQKAGGNLSEALGNLSGCCATARVAGQDPAMAEAKASAAIIGALPIIVMVLVYLTSPLTSRCSSPPVGNMILARRLLDESGLLVMRK